MNDLSPSPPEIAEALWRYHAGPGPALVGDDLDALVDQFIQLKRYLGHRYHASGNYAKDFVRILRERGLRRASDLTDEAVMAWADSHRGAQTLTWMRRISAVSVFLDHLKAIGKIPGNPCKLLRRRRPSSRFRPYIFSGDELRRILSLADRPGIEGDLGLVYYFIYACGLRASEAARLRMEDTPLDRGTVFIRKTKFNKDRLLPIHPAVAARLKRHVAERRAGAGPADTVFVDSLAGGAAYTSRTLSACFREDLVRLGIYSPTHEADGLRYGSPRLHALRHTFAVNCLLRWYQQGADVQAKLPLLSTYLGHSHIEHTQVYLTVTGLLLQAAHRRFSARWESTLPLSP
jgi:integrase/recombinase XerD